MHARLLVVSVFLAACGAAPDASEAPPHEATAGGEDASREEAGGEGTVRMLGEALVPGESDEPSRPVVLRNTIPVPVPQPAVARERLSGALEEVWTHVETQVSVARPRGPEVESVETVQSWANGPFLEWIGLRRQHLERTRELLEAVPDDPPYERALAVALFAYAFEDFGAQVAGAPVPREIARDEELRAIYIRSLNEATIPLGQRAIELYADCQRRLERLGDESRWLPWRAYCVQRGQDVIRGYGLAPDQP